MDDFEEQIKDALMLDPFLNEAIQQFASIDVQAVVTADAKFHTGEVGITFGLVVYQTYGSRGSPLIGITGTLAPGRDFVPGTGTEPVIIGVGRIPKP